MEVKQAGSLKENKMRNFLLSNEKQNKPFNHDRILKATALLYLKEALFKEKYEDCAGLIQNAKDFGAEAQEISGLLTDHVLGVKAKNVKVIGYRRF